MTDYGAAETQGNASEQQGITLTIGGNSVTIKCGNAQHMGARPYQEDSFGYSDLTDADRLMKSGLMAVLADGMGGLKNGRQVSEYTVNALKTMFLNFNANADPGLQLRRAVEEINKVVCSRFSVGGQSSAGSTIVAAWLIKNKLFWVSVGDSRIYLIRDGQMFPFNEDHDHFNQLLVDYMRDDITMSEINSDPQKDNLASYIGRPSLSVIDGNHVGFSLKKGDKLVLCSDGVYNCVSVREIISFTEYEPQTACEQIIKRGLSKRLPGQDNMTIMIINYG